MFATAPSWLWLVFGCVIAVFLAIDLGIFNRDQHVVTTRQALSWLAVWAALAGGFAVFLNFYFDHERALSFVTGYVVEYALSVDNIFVFIVIFEYFRVPREYQHRVLFWGIVGAAVLRAVFIFAGTALIQRFHWLIYLFGAFLIFTGVKILLSKEDDEVDPDKSPLVRIFRRMMPLSSAFDGARFFTRENGRRLATPLLLVLAVVEGTDVLFALDSIPAIFAVTTDPFVVYTSNIFAILGLRNLYFVLADFMNRFQYLKVGLGFVLVFVGAKMAVSDIYHVPIVLSLGVIVALLAGSITFSWWKSRAQQSTG